MVALSSMWERIQSNLFPFLEEELGELTAKQQKLVSILAIIRVEESISYTYNTGRPPADRKAISEHLQSLQKANDLHGTGINFTLMLLMDKSLSHRC